MKAILEKLFEHQPLTENEAREILTNLANGHYNSSQMASFLTVYRMRNLTVEELTGFRNAMLDLCIPVDFSEFNTIDLCGTGGDQKNTFNISTLASFIVAGTGEKVIKHGNYSVSSSCGSSNILEYFGYRFSNNADKLRKELERTGICFLHAPLFHPAMKNVAPVRKELGIKTFFNILGPMVNPGNPPNQMIGVYDAEVSRIFHYIYQDTGKNHSIIHNLDGYDEISLTDTARIEASFGNYFLSSQNLGFPSVNPREITNGENIDQSARLFRRILAGEGTTSQNNVAVANAAVALKTLHPNASLEQCVDKARRSLTGKYALQIFTYLLNLQ
jgi:anthranilate phosphoribosyltransferase